MAEMTETHAAKVHFYIPDHLIPQFADVSFASHTDSDFRLSFYVTVVPAYGKGQAQEMISDGEDRELVVRAKCVAQIVLTPEHAKVFMEALQKNYQSFMADRNQQRGTQP